MQIPKELEINPIMSKDEKQDTIEKRISFHFLNKLLNKTIKLEDLNKGKHLDNEPDMLYENFGIELGTVISNTNECIEKYEIDFLDYLNKNIEGLIDENLQIHLIIQTDKEYLLYDYFEEFEDYPKIRQYCSKFYIQKYDKPITPQVIFAPNSSKKFEKKLPNIKKKKEINPFIKEIIKYTNNIQSYTYIEFFKAAHYEGFIWDRKTRKNVPLAYMKFDIGKELFPPKIIEKFQKDKYMGKYSKQILLLHNYTEELQSKMTLNQHLYWHERDIVFNIIKEIIVLFDSYQYYDEIYFADFSKNIYEKNVNIINFKE